MLCLEDDTATAWWDQRTVVRCKKCAVSVIAVAAREFTGVEASVGA